MNIALTQAKEIIGTTTLSDAELEERAKDFFRCVPELDEVYYKEDFIKFIRARETAFKYDAGMYGDDGGYKGRDTNDEGEPA